MRLSVRYTAQLRTLTNRDEEVVTVAEHCSVSGLLMHLAARQPAIAGHLLTSSGKIQAGLLVSVNGSAVSSRDAENRGLAADDVVTLLPPIAGG